MAPRSARRDRPALILALALTAAACETKTLECDAHSLDATGAATFEGESHTFNDGSGSLRLAGSRKHPCLISATFYPEGSSAGMQVSLSPAQDGEPLHVSYVGFGGPVSPMDYGLYPDDEPEFDASFELGDADDDCAEAEASVSADSARMYLTDSEDFGPYSLTDVSISVSGTWYVTWVEDACPG